MHQGIFAKARNFVGIMRERLEGNPIGHLDALQKLRNSAGHLAFYQPKRAFRQTNRRRGKHEPIDGRVKRAWLVVAHKSERHEAAQAVAK